ncbi:MAG: hypothetical protein K6F39_05125 [Lachnospiraceae bacterium]|nr:hypothetical protein [Lachnospiraceae bacterium]
MADEEKDEKKPKKEKKPKPEKKGAADGGAEDEEDEGGALSVVLVTIFIVIVWLAILALLVKLDIGGFGTSVLTPVLKNVPVVNRILPGYSLTASGNSVSDDGVLYAGYDNLDDAIARIKELENELTAAQQASNDTDQTIADLQAEVSRLKTFETNQVEFEKIKDEFYNEVVFGDKAPDISEYQKYYEQIDPTNAQILYKQVVQKEQTDSEIEDYAKTYSAMKAKDAAEIFDTMGSNLSTVAKILNAMSSDARGNILGAMDPEIAASLTKLMEPSSSSSSSSTTYSLGDTVSDNTTE